MPLPLLAIASVLFSAMSFAHTASQEPPATTSGVAEAVRREVLRITAAGTSPRGSPRPCVLQLSPRMLVGLSPRGCTPRSVVGSAA